MFLSSAVSIVKSMKDGQATCIARVKRVPTYVELLNNVEH